MGLPGWRPVGRLPRSPARPETLGNGAFICSGLLGSSLKLEVRWSVGKSEEGGCRGQVCSLADLSCDAPSPWGDSPYIYTIDLFGPAPV